MSRSVLPSRPLSPSALKPRERKGRVWTLADVRVSGESQVSHTRRAFEITHADTWSQEIACGGASFSDSQLVEWGDGNQDPGWDDAPQAFFDDFAQTFPDEVFNDLVYGDESQDVWGWEMNQAWEEEKIVLSTSPRRRKSRRRAR
jgi:hypothetical protein